MDWTPYTVKPIRKKLRLTLEPHREVDMGEFDVDVFLRSLEGTVRLKTTPFVVKRVGGVCIQIKKMRAVAALDNLPPEIMGQSKFVTRILEKFGQEQKKIVDYLTLKPAYRGVLLYGSDCAAVAAVESFLHDRTIYMFVPKTEKFYRNEINLCADSLKTQQHWIFMNGTWEAAEGEPNYSEHRAAIDDHVEAMERRFKFILYNESLEFPHSFDNALVVIDEAHSFISKIMKTPLYESLLAAQNCRVVALSGMPLVNSTDELAVLYNILRGFVKVWSVRTEETTLPFKETINYSDYSQNTWTLTRLPDHFVRVDAGLERTLKPWANDAEFLEKLRKLGSVRTDNFKVFEDSLDGVDEDTFKRRVAGLTAFFEAGACIRKRNRVYPVRMSGFQRKKYEKEEKEKDAQRVGNFAYPDEVKEDDVAEMVKMGVFTDHLEQYSPKFGFMLKNMGLFKGQQLVYSRFKESLRLFAEMLGQHGFEELKLVKRNGAWKVEGTKPKYIFFEGKGAEEQLILKHIFNKEWGEVPSIRVDGLDCRIALTTTVVPLRDVEHVHVMEPCSDPIRVEEVVGTCRGSVTAHMYLTTTQHYTTPLDFEGNLVGKRKKEDTVDEYVYKMAEEKKTANLKWLKWVQNTEVPKERQKQTVKVANKQVHFYSEKEDGDFYAVYRTQTDPVKVAYMRGSNYYKLNFDKYNKKIEFFRDLIKV